MSWAEDEFDGIMTDDECELLENIRDKRVWVTREKEIIGIREMKLSHIENCIKGIKGGKTFYGQGFKLEALEAEKAPRIR